MCSNGETALNMAANVTMKLWETISANMSLEDYLHIRLGPQRLDLSIVIPITVIYGIIFLTGIIGNVCTCLVITRNNHLHTSTNYYLFNLALADVLTLLLGLPNDLSVYWQQYPYIFGVVVCKTRAMVSEMTSNASVLTIVAFTTERYVAICHPFKSQKLSALSRAIKTIIVLWIVACVSASPFAIFTTIHYVDFPAGSGNYSAKSAFCSVAIEDYGRYVPLFQFSTFAFFVMPLVAISALYIKIGLRLRRAKIRSQISDSSLSERDLPSRRVVLNILVAVVVTFFVCWAPFHAQRLLVVYVSNNAWNASLRTINETLYYIAGCCYYINCTTNPIFYTVMSKKYRKAFERAIHCTSRSLSRSWTTSKETTDTIRDSDNKRFASKLVQNEKLSTQHTMKAIYVIKSQPRA